MDRWVNTTHETVFGDKPLILSVFSKEYTPRTKYTLQSTGSRTELFYRFPTNAIHRAAIVPRSWNGFSQKCKLALV